MALAPAFPASFPAVAIEMLVQRLRGGAVDNPTAAQAAWILVGYGCTFIPASTPPTPVVTDDGRSLLDHLEALQAAQGKKTAIPWSTWAVILTKAVAFILSILSPAA